MADVCAYRLAKVDIELAHDHSEDVAGGFGAEPLLVQVPKGLTQPAEHTAPSLCTSTSSGHVADAAQVCTSPMTLHLACCVKASQFCT